MTYLFCLILWLVSPLSYGAEKFSTVEEINITLTENTTRIISLTMTEEEKIQSLNQPQNGSTAINADETIIYTPELGFIGTDMAFVIIQNSHSHRRLVNINITVEPKNNQWSYSYDDGETWHNIMANEAPDIKTLLLPQEPMGFTPDEIPTLTLPPPMTMKDNTPVNKNNTKFDK